MIQIQGAAWAGFFFVGGRAGRGRDSWRALAGREKRRGGDGEGQVMGGDRCLLTRGTKRRWKATGAKLADGAIRDGGCRRSKGLARTVRVCRKRVNKPRLSCRAAAMSDALGSFRRRVLNSIGSEADLLHAPSFVYQVLSSERLFPRHLIVNRRVGGRGGSCRVVVSRRIVSCRRFVS